MKASAFGEFLDAEFNDTKFFDLALQPRNEIVESLPLDAFKCTVRTLASDIGEFQSVQKIADNVFLRELLVDSDVAEDDHAFQHGTKQQACLHNETLTAQKRCPLVIVDKPDQNACANKATSIARVMQELAPHRMGQPIGVARQPEQVSQVRRITFRIAPAFAPRYPLHSQESTESTISPTGCTNPAMKSSVMLLAGNLCLPANTACYFAYGSWPLRKHAAYYRSGEGFVQTGPVQALARIRHTVFACQVPLSLLEIRRSLRWLAICRSDRPPVGAWPISRITPCSAMVPSIRAGKPGLPFAYCSVRGDQTKSNGAPFHKEIEQQYKSFLG